jgi:ankyrin repeat protein
MSRACDREGATALHAAAGEGMEDLVAWLLARGASPRKRDLQGLTPLDWCALGPLPATMARRDSPP